MLSLYIHFPFCISKCLYCSFISTAAISAGEREAYVENLARELALAAMTPGIGGRTLDTVYIGGGTPSLMPPAALEKLMSTIRNLFPVSGEAEISVESNPGSVSDPAAWLSAARALGVNRVVVGVQSLDDAQLKFLGRVHDRSQALSFYRAAQAAGFDSVGIDLIYGLPGGTVAEWQQCLSEAVSLGPDHVSIYCLEITGGTPLGRALEEGRFEEQKPDIQAAMYEAARETLETAGFAAYEISNFAKPGHDCRHNLVYWTGGDYYGAGLSACSHLGGSRYENERDMEKYTGRIRAGMLPRMVGEYLSPDRRLRELAIMALRTTRGFRPELPRSNYERALLADLDRLETEGILEKDSSGTFRLPRKLRFVSDSVFSRIV